MIRKATGEESQARTKISFASKGYWRYPAANFKIWQDELTITNRP